MNFDQLKETIKDALREYDHEKKLEERESALLVKCAELDQKEALYFAKRELEEERENARKSREVRHVPPRPLDA